MWWLYGAVGIAALIFAALSPRPRRAVIVAGLFILCLTVHVVGTSYLGMLYQAAQKDASGNIVWTLDLADRVRDTTAVLYTNAVVFAIDLFLALWSIYEHVMQRRLL